MLRNYAETVLLHKISTPVNKVKLRYFPQCNELKFEKHINELCRKASSKIRALQRTRRFLSVDKARLLANAFIDSQFSYASLIQMFTAKTLINKICKAHDRTLELVYDDFEKLYDELLD